MITSEEICKELQIDLNTLKEYEEFLALPGLSEGGAYHTSIAKLIVKVHELVQKGYKFSEIKSLSAFADQFKELIPSLSSYADLNPQRTLKELNLYYQELLYEFAEREQKYQETISELQEQIKELFENREHGEKLAEHLESLKTELDRHRLEISYREDEIKELLSKVQQLELQNSDQLHEISKRDSLIEQLQKQLKITNTEELESLPNYAVDIDSLLKKKEKEKDMEHQKQIHELKKQFKYVVEQKQKEWVESLRNK